MRIERSANFYRFLHTTYSLFIRFRGKTYRVSLFHRKLPFREIESGFYSILQENLHLKARIKALEDL